MSGEANKTIIKRVNHALNTRDWDLLSEIMEANLVEGLKASWTLAAFPDIQITIEDIIAEDDKVVTRWTNHGTHTATYMGIAPTGHTVSYTGISIDRVENGKIVESWRNSDTLGLLRQIGGEVRSASD